ncbi:meiosis-specific protein MEI4-like [Argopecten irradians]|uniref:meiosis-specific protein MEI4-like n=1 Tax=Argopecten irradians TaxID=31199 RepID=UPI00371D8EB2
MEPDDPSTSQENSLVQEVRLMKICVAVACCALKPKDTSARSFTEGLCNAFQRTNQKLQHKHTSMEAEILNLRQQIVLNSLSSRETNCEQGASQADEAVLFPTPPLSGSDRADRTETEDLECLQRNTQFLQSVINIQQITRQSSKVTGDGDNNSASAAKLKSLTSLNQTTIVKSLQTVLKCVQEKTFTTSAKSMHHCVQCVVQLMQQVPDLMSNVQIVSLIKDIIRSLVADILKEDIYLSHANARQEGTNLVLEFSKPPVTRLTQEIFVNEIQKFSQHLQDVCLNSKPLHVSWFENIIFVIQLLQTILGADHICSRTDDGNRLQSLKDSLEDSLLHITHRFPLYAHSIWNVCGQLELKLHKNNL